MKLAGLTVAETRLLTDTLEQATHDIIGLRVLDILAPKLKALSADMDARVHAAVSAARSAETAPEIKEAALAQVLSVLTAEFNTTLSEAIDISEGEQIWLAERLAALGNSLPGSEGIRRMWINIHDAVDTAAAAADG